MSDLKTYIGVKRIQAEPQERNGKPGYRVIYEPDGYESWSPKDVFEAAYLPISRPDRLMVDDINDFINASDIHVEKCGEKSTLVEIEFPTGWKDYARFLPVSTLRTMTKNWKNSMPSPISRVDSGNLSVLSSNGQTTD